MARSRRVDDVYPVLKQWTFLAYERTKGLDAAIETFYAARAALNEWRQSLAPGTVSMSPEGIGYESAIYRVQGESYFLMSAATQVVRILDADPDLGRLPRGLHTQVRQIRNVLEHWDEWTEDETRHGGQTSAARLRAVDPEAWPFGFKFADGDFLVGGVVPLSTLRDEFDALWLWLKSPPPGRIFPSHSGPSHPYPLDR